VNKLTGWKRPFDDPIPLPGSRKIVTLADAGDYIAGLPKKESSLPEWQAAIEALLLVVKYKGPTMMARIGVMRGMNRLGWLRDRLRGSFVWRAPSIATRSSRVRRSHVS
jgi:hypothetical protein